MQLSFKPLLAAAILALPAGVQAQAPIDPSVTVSIVAWPFQTRGAGGFLADFAIDFPSKPTETFEDYLVWCIDPNRSINVPGGPYTYQAFSALGFAGTSLGATNGYDVTVGDMGGIVSLVSDLRTNWSSYSNYDRGSRQSSIWAIFRGETPEVAGIPTASTDGWVVLYNGENQTLLTYVAEPADSVLMLTVLFGMAFLVLARRRRA